MKIEIFDLERIQSTWENIVKYNLTESGIHPYSLKELLTKDEIEELLSIRLGYGQTNGSIELRDAISRLYLEADRGNVLVTNGSAEANFIAIWSNLETNDELILMLPNYMQIWGISRSFGIKIKPFYLKEGRNWGVDLEELESLVSSRTKMIAICNPNNPTGAVLGVETMKDIVEIAREVEAWVYADEIYIGAELSGEETPSFWGFYDKAIVSSGLSKAYALPGLRIGWLVGPKDIIEKSWSYHDYTSITTSIFSNKVATLILQPEMRMKVLNRNRRVLRENLSILTKWVKKYSDLFSFIPPQAGGIVFLRYNLPINSTELSTKLREEKDVFIIAGDCFGMDNYIRIGIGSEKDYFISGLNLIDEFISEYLK
ncbi:MAG: aminotransferase class I/II-fold pyridoxal phosphate-dependent enzyme [Candidatus Hodarchaeota archaeon]